MRQVSPVDILVDVNGTVVPVWRDMRWVASCWKDIISAVPDVLVYMRKHFDAVDKAREYAMGQGMPYDGIVGIRVR